MDKKESQLVRLSDRRKVMMVLRPMSKLGCVSVCLCGFQEHEKPRSDSPTAAKEMTKMILAIAANEKWMAESMDVTAAFLQGETIDRDVYVTPPKKMQVE